MRKGFWTSALLVSLFLFAVGFGISRLAREPLSFPQAFHGSDDMSIELLAPHKNDGYQLYHFPTRLQAESACAMQREGAPIIVPGKYGGYDCLLVFGTPL